MEDDENSCKICFGVADHMHFGAQSCRSCASFFRRAVVSKRSYKCLRSNDCILNKGARHCKACRFKKCLNSGMRASAVQTNRDPLGPKYLRTKAENTEDSPDTQTTQLPKSTYSNELVPNGSLVQHFLVIDKLCAAFRDFEQAERALYALLFPEYAEEPKYRATIHTDFIKMERGTMTSAITLIEQWFPFIKTQSQEFKRSVLHNFFPTFSAMLKCYRTALIFPDPDSRLVLAYCQYEDISNSDYHFQHNKNPTEAGRLCLGFRLRTRTMAAKFNDLGIQCVEVIAMASLLLCNEVEMLLGNHRAIDNFRQQIYVDLHKLNETNESYGLRIGILSCLLSDIVNLRQQVHEVVTLLKIFTPHRIELFPEFEDR